LTSGRVDQLVENLYHELTHSEQQNIVLRHLADLQDKPIGASFTEEQALALKRGYAELGDTVSIEHVRSVLENRGGARLAGDDIASAERLMDAFRQNRPPGPEYGQLGND